MPTQKRTFVCKKHGTPGYDQTYTCTATDKSCGCQSDRGKAQEQPTVHGSQAVFCTSCQCCHCCLPAHTVVTSRCRLTPENVCRGSLVGDNLTHINASMHRSVQVCLRNSNKKRRPKVKKYNFSIESIKMLGSLFCGTRSTSLNYKEVNECQRRTECYCSQNRPQTDHAGSTAVQQTQFPAPCPSESSSSLPSMKPKGSISSKFKSLTFGRHLKQLLTKFDKDLNDLPDRRTIQRDTDTDECSGANSLGPNEKIKGFDSQSNGIKCSSAPSACRKSDAVSVFWDNDMFTTEKCPKVNQTCANIQEGCGHLTRTKNEKCYNMNSGTPVCFQRQVHCCGCKCECCRIKENMCIKEQKSHTNVCSVCSQTDVGSEKASKKTCSENNQDSTQIHQSQTQEHLPSQKETNTSIAPEKQTRSSTTEEVVDIEPDVPKTDAHSEDTKPSSQPTASDQNDDNSNVSTTDEQQERSKIIDRETIPETEIQSTDFQPLPAIEDKLCHNSFVFEKRFHCREQTDQSARKKFSDDNNKTEQENPSRYHNEFTSDDKYTPRQGAVTNEESKRIPSAYKSTVKEQYTLYNEEEKLIKPSEDENKDVKEQTKEPEIIVKGAKKGKAAGESYTDFTDFKNKSQTLPLPHTGRCRDPQHRDVQTGQLPKQNGSYEYNILKPSIFCAIKRKSENKKDSSQQSEVIRRNYCDEHQKKEAKSPCGVYMTQSPSVDTAQDVEPVDMNQSEEDSGGMLTPTSDLELSQADDSDGIIYAMSNNTCFKDTTDSKLLRSIFSSQDDTQEQSTICNLPDLDSEILEMKCQQDRINDFAQLLRMQYSTNNVPQQADKPAQDTLQHGDNPQLKQNNSFVSKNDCQQLEGNNTFTSKNKCQQIKRKNTFTNKNDIHQIKRSDIFTGNNDHEHIKRNQTVTDQIGCEQVKRHNTFTCRRQRKHHATTSLVPKVPVALEEKDIINFPTDNCTKRHIQCTSKEHLVKSIQDNKKQIKRNECQQYLVTKLAGDSSNANQTPASSIRCKTKSKTFALPQVHRCKDCQRDETANIRKHDFQLPNVHRCKDCQNDEIKILRKQEFQLPNVHRCKDCQNDETDTKQKDLQSPNIRRKNSCQKDEIENEHNLQLPNIHRYNICQNDKIDNKRQDLQASNMPRRKYDQRADTDILSQHELHIHKGYISNRKQVKTKPEHERHNFSVFCTIKKKQAKLKDMGYFEESEGSKHDKMYHNVPKEHLHSPCHVCPFSADETGDTESSDIGKETSLTPENVKTISKANKSSLIKETSAGKAQDSVGIGYSMSNSEFKDGKLLSGVFSPKDNSHDQSTVRSLPDLDSEVSVMRVQHNLLKDISELLHRQARAKEDAYNQSNYDSDSGHLYLNNCLPTRCSNSVLQCNSSSEMQENILKDRFDCSCTNLGHHLLVCRPCSRQFGPNRCLRRSKEHTSMNHPSEDFPHLNQCAPCQCSSLENCRFGRYFIVKSNSNNLENTHNISTSYLDSEEASVNQSSFGLNTTPAEQASLQNTHSTQYQLHFACNNTECNKHRTSSPSLAYLGNLLNQLGSFICPELATYENVLSNNDTNYKKGKIHRQGGSFTIERSEQGDNFTIKQHEQGSSFTISKIVTDSKTVRLCLEQGYKYNGYRSANHRQKCRKMHNRNVTEPGQEELRSKISSHTSSSKQDNDIIINSDYKRQTPLGNTSSHKTSCNEQGLFSTDRNTGNRSQREVSKNDSKNSQQELCNIISNDSCSSKPELCNHVSNSSNTSSREPSNISNESNRHTRELSTTSSKENIQNNKDFFKASLQSTALTQPLITKELSDSPNNISDINKCELSSPVSDDSNTSKQKQISIISNHNNQSKKEAGNWASNIGNRTIKDKINCLLNHFKISKGNLGDTGTNQNSEEINNKTVSDSIIHKKENDNELIIGSGKREQNDIISNSSAINNKDINTFVNYISKRNKKEGRSKVYNENKTSKQEKSEMFNNENYFSKKETKNTDGNHKIKSRSCLCCPDFNSEERNPKEPSYIYMDRDAQNHKDAIYTDSTHDARSQIDPHITGSNNDVRNHSDCSQDTNCKYQKHIYSSDAELNDQDREHTDLSDPDHRLTRHKHNDPVKEDQSRKEGSHINPSNTECKSKDGRHKDSTDAGLKRKSMRHNELRDAERNFKGRSLKDSSNAKFNYKEKGHKESINAESNPKRRRHAGSNNVEFNPKDRSHKESRNVELNPKSKGHKQSSNVELNPKDRGHKESCNVEVNPKDKEHKESGNVEHNPKDRGRKELKDAVPSHKSQKHKDPNYAASMHEDEKDEEDTGQVNSSLAHSSLAQHSHGSYTLSYSVSLSDTGEQQTDTHSNIKCIVTQTGLCVQTETHILPLQHRSFHKTSNSSHTEDGLKIAAHETPCFNCHYRKKRKHKITGISDEEASVNSKKCRPLRKEMCQICEGPCFNCAHLQVKGTVAQETNYQKQSPMIGSVRENKSSPICQSFSDSQDFPSEMFTTSAPQKRERKLCKNPAQSYKWQPQDISQHPLSRDSSEHISSNSLCQDKSKLFPFRNCSPEFFSDSFGSSDYPKCHTRETLPAFSSQCKNSACQHDSYISVHKEGSNSPLSPSYSQRVNNTSKESPESSHGTGGLKTNSGSCSFRLYNMLPCQTCGKIKSVLRRQNCCEISSTSMV